VYEVPLPRERVLNMKHTPEFLALRSQILERIRDTCGMRTDLELLQRLSQQAMAT
jgi:NitT/TauT family transport system ATP-binding protein